MSTAPRRRPVALVVGAGRLARAVAPRLLGAGWPVRAVVVRSDRAARAMAAAAPGIRCTRSLRLDGAEVVLLAVPDRAVSPLATALAAANPGFAGLALHFSGALGPEAAAPLVDRERAAVLHPLQSLGPGGSDLLAGSRARIEGGRTARPVALAMARALGLRPFRPTRPASAADRARYHAAAAVAANDLVALLAIAVDRFVEAGVRREDAVDGAVSLARGVLANVERAGLRDGLTGPVARGDVATLRRHLDVLRRGRPDDARVHRLLSRRLADLVGDRLDRADLARLRRLVGGGPPGDEDV